jgi:hypothetical protein
VCAEKLQFAFFGIDPLWQTAIHSSPHNVKEGCPSTNDNGILKEGSPRMTSSWILRRRWPVLRRSYLLILANLLLGASHARADWIGGQTTLTLSDTLPVRSEQLGGYGTAGILINRGPWGTSDFPAGSAQVQFVADSWNGQYGPNQKNGIPQLDAVAFNTDLALSPTQIIAPPGWILTQNAPIAGFSWEATSTAPQYNSEAMWLTITSLGSNASLWDFQNYADRTGITPLPPAVYFAAHISGITPSAATDFATEQWVFSTIPPPLPEPSALVLAGLGVVGLFGRRVARSVSGPRHSIR